MKAERGVWATKYEIPDAQRYPALEQPKQFYSWKD